MGNIDEIQPYQMNQMFKEIVNEIEDCLMIYDLEGQLIYANRQVEHLTGYSKKELVENTQLSRLEKVYKLSLIEKMERAVANGRKFDAICNLSKKDGTPFYLAISMMGIKDENNQLDKYICIAKDMTSAKELHEKIHQIKYIDEVTGLPSQTAFAELMYGKIDSKRDKAFAVILVDISKMSYINNTYGLTAGDTIIKEMGRRIQAVIGHRCLLAKLSTDVFAIIQDYSKSKASTEALVEDIFKQLEQPIHLAESDIYIEVNCGIAIYPNHGETAGEIINKAQITLAKTKEKKTKNQYLFYDDSMQEEVQKRMLLESDIRTACKNNEFIVYYQPFIDLDGRKLTGMEALLRRKKANGEIIPPGKFIGLLEQMELIEEVGICVIEKVCKQLREWIDAGYEVVPVSINLSSIQFKNSDLSKEIMNVLQHYDISPNMLILEITETVVMTDVERTQKTITKLKEYGFTIAIDDFGTGYSSLGYLKKFLFDHLKIDISFIRGIVENPQDRAIVAAIISIAKALQLKTVAEGIETLEQLNLMHEMGCEIGQGYYWDAPMDPKKLKEKYLVK